MSSTGSAGEVALGRGAGAASIEISGLRLSNAAQGLSGVGGYAQSLEQFDLKLWTIVACGAIPSFIDK